jgi:hypothetical protein
MNTRTINCLSASFAISAFLCSSVQAATLEDLFNGSDVQVDDKLFSDWTWEHDNSSTIIDYSNIQVIGVDDIPLNPGLRFLANNNAFQVSGGDFIDISFSFKVTVTKPGLFIKDASLSLVDFTLSALTDAVIQIDDSVFTADPFLLDTLTVNADSFGTTPFASTEFDRYTMLFQEIDIVIDSGFDGAVTSVTEFLVRKSQIPEPTVIALVAFGMAGIVGLQRKYRDKGQIQNLGKNGDRQPLVRQGN